LNVSGCSHLTSYELLSYYFDMMNFTNMFLAFTEIMMPFVV